MKVSHLLLFTGSALPFSLREELSGHFKTIEQGSAKLALSRKLSLKPFNTILLDNLHTEMDALELVLNLRDMKFRGNILVLRTAIEDNVIRSLKSMPNVHIIQQTTASLRVALRKIFSREEHTAVIGT